VCPANAFCNGSAVCAYTQPNPVGVLKVTPSLIGKNKTVQVSWNIANVQSCTVTGSNGDSWSGLTSGATPKTSQPIVQKTVYTLSCVVFDPSAGPFIETASVSLVPTYQER
jgi:hypothetical protein